MTRKQKLGVALMLWPFVGWFAGVVYAAWREGVLWWLGGLAAIAASLIVGPILASDPDDTGW